MEKTATTLRLPEDHFKLLKAIAGYEGKSMTEIFSELAAEYIERHRETMELLRIPDFLKDTREGLKEIKKGGGKRLRELDR